MQFYFLINKNVVTSNRRQHLTKVPETLLWTPEIFFTDTDNDDDHDDDKLIMNYSCETVLTGPMLEILPIANLRDTASRIWICGQVDMLNEVAQEW